jgi:hypothetical protein
MATTEQPAALEEQIAHWRSYLLRRQAIHSVDVAELEDHLREQIDGLVEGGLAADEAFLIAVKRMGDLDTLSREFAREHSERLWKQLVVSHPDAGAPAAGAWRDALTAFALATGAAIAIKLPDFLGVDTPSFLARNVPLLVLPFLSAYFVWKRRLAPRTVGWLAAAFLAAALAANVYPLLADGSTLVLSALHLPIGLWFLVGIAYAGGRWSRVEGRMDFVRFSGELFIYYVLIALGGGLLTGFIFMIFTAIGIDPEPFFETWILPCGAAGAVLVAAWLVEAKQSVIENMAPVLTRLFTPMFTIALLTFLATLVLTGRELRADREVLIVFDLLLIVVLALLLYSVSARDPHAPPSIFDALQIVLVLSALVADAVALWAIAARISEFGFTPNRVAGLGVNVILLVNLAWAAVLYLRFVRGRGSFAAVEKWQTDYLPVYALWAAVVVVVFPPLFGYI